MNSTEPICHVTQQCNQEGLLFAMLFSFLYFLYVAVLVGRKTEIRGQLFPPWCCADMLWKLLHCNPYVL